MATLYCFFKDQFLMPKDKIVIGELSTSGLGYLDDDGDNYFNNPCTVRDHRTERLTILTEPITDQCSFVFDYDQIQEPDELLTTPLENFEQLFDIIERVVYPYGSTQQQLDTLLSGAANYSIYRSGSLIISAHTTAYTHGEEVVHVPNWVQFDVMIDTHEYTFKIWVNQEAFKEDYPISTIVGVIPPCNPAHLLDPSQFHTTIGTLVKSGRFSFELVDEHVENDDHTGMIVYYTIYNNAEDSVVDLPFGVFYKGNVPSTLQIRKAIREYLLSLGLADEDLWKEILPDLFVKAQFFLIPVWDNVVERLNGTFFPSFIKTKRIKTIVDAVMTDISEDFRDDMTELITNSHDECFILSVPNPINEDIFSFLDSHPSYQNHSTSDPAFSYQDVDTRLFNRRLATAMAIIQGETNSEVAKFNTNVFDGKSYLSFVVAEVEYHVLKKESFEMIFTP